MTCLVARSSAKVICCNGIINTFFTFFTSEWTSGVIADPTLPARFVCPHLIKKQKYLTMPVVEDVSNLGEAEASKEELASPKIVAPKVVEEDDDDDDEVNLFTSFNQKVHLPLGSDSRSDMYRTLPLWFTVLVLSQATVHSYPNVCKIVNGYVEKVKELILL